jgi:IS1 family transposase
VTGTILGWGRTQRDDVTLQWFLDWIGIKGRTFPADDWAGFHRLIPEAQLDTGKDLTVRIEASSSGVRHHLARLTRRCKVRSRSAAMAELPLRLAAYLRVIASGIVRCLSLSRSPILRNTPQTHLRDLRTAVLLQFSRTFANATLLDSLKCV